MARWSSSASLRTLPNESPLEKQWRTKGYQAAKDAIPVGTRNENIFHPVIMNSLKPDRRQAAGQGQLQLQAFVKGVVEYCTDLLVGDGAAYRNGAMMPAGGDQERIWQTNIRNLAEILQQPPSQPIIKERKRDKLRSAFRRGK